MTNRELAEHYAGLEPDEPARIHLLEADTGCVDHEPVVAFTEQHAEYFPAEDLSDAGVRPGAPVVFRKY